MFMQRTILSAAAQVQMLEAECARNIQMATAQSAQQFWSARRDRVLHWRMIAIVCRECGNDAELRMFTQGTMLRLYARRQLGFEDTGMALGL